MGVVIYSRYCHKCWVLIVGVVIAVIDSGCGYCSY